MLEKKRGLTERREAVGLACLGEGGVNGGLSQRRKGHLTGVRRHGRAERVKEQVLKSNQGVPAVFGI